MTCWIAVYHSSANVKMHIKQLLHHLSICGFHARHKKVLKDYLIEMMCLYPQKPIEKFQNLSYFYHHAEVHGQIKIDHKDFSKLFILTKMLDLGQTYHNTEGMIFIFHIT